MNIQHIQYFLKLAEIQHFTKAADELYLTQANLSYIIKTMEDELNASLFVRTSRKVELSTAGKAFLPYANRLWETWLDAVGELAAQGDDGSEAITVAFPPSISHSEEFVRFVQKTKEEPGLENCRLILKQAKTTRDMVDMLNNGEVDFMLCYTADISVQSFKLYDKEIFVYMPAGHRLSEAETLTWPEIEEEDWIIGSESSFMGQYIKSKYLFSKRKPNIIAAVDDMWVQLLYTAKGNGIMIAPSIMLPDDMEVVYKRLDPVLTFPIYLSCKKDQTFTKAQEELVRFMEDFFFETEADRMSGLIDES